MRGLILIDRAILDHHIVGVKNKDRFCMWVWMLSAASWKSRVIFVGGKEVPLARGQFFASIRTIAAENHVSKGIAERFIRDLKSVTMVETDGSIITVCNYDKYQRFDNYGKTASETDARQRQDSDGTATGHKRTTEETTDGTTDEIRQAFDAFKSSAGKSGWTIPEKLSQKRKAIIKGRMKDCRGMDGWQSAIERANASDFLSGRTSHGFKLSLDFFAKDENFTKIMEGNYDNRTSQNSPASNGRGSGPHDSIMAGFAAFADSEPSASGSDSSVHSPADHPGNTAMDRGQGGNTSQPVLRIINPD